MLEIEQDGQRVLDDLVRLAALDVGDESDPAGILFLRRIEQAEALCAHRRPRAPRASAPGLHGPVEVRRIAPRAAPPSIYACARGKGGGARGRTTIQGGNLRAAWRPLAAYFAAVRRALAPAVGPRTCCSALFSHSQLENKEKADGTHASANEIGQQCCPMRNMANSGCNTQEHRPFFPAHAANGKESAIKAFGVGPFAARSSAMSYDISGPRVVNKRKESRARRRSERVRETDSSARP